MSPAQLGMLPVVESVSPRRQTSPCDTDQKTPSSPARTANLHTADAHMRWARKPQISPADACPTKARASLARTEKLRGNLPVRAGKPAAEPRKHADRQEKS